jgi:hypothetical protein
MFNRTRTRKRAFHFQLVVSSCFVALLLSAAPARALVYDTGTLSFESTGQSMWDSGNAFRRSESVFVGEEWANRTATLGEILGSQNTVIIRGTNSVTVRWFEPRINLGFTSIGCGCDRSKTIPGIPAVTADTRTGAEVSLTTSGKVGLEFGYSIDSGSVDTSADFRASASLPDLIQANQLFSLDTSSVLDNGTIQTQSPKIDAYMSAIMQLSGSIEAQACLAPFGCSGKGSVNLPTIDMDQRILSVDLNSFKVLEGAGPGGDPIAETNLFNQSLTLEGGATVAPPAVGFKMTTLNGALTVVNTLPPTPSVTVDLAELEVQVPDIATNGSGSGAPITSSGRDDVVNATVDIDGVATMVAGLPPAGLNFDLIDTPVFKVGASLDLIDVDAGPVLGLTQDFEFEPTLMASIDFSNPVVIDGLTGVQSNWIGEWSALPDIAISQDTTFNPEFWIGATLKNTLGLDLGLEGTLDILKLGATASVGGLDVLGLNPITLNELLGIGNTLFETDKLNFDVYSNRFALGGFTPMQGTPFTLALGSNASRVGVTAVPASSGVPLPGSLWLCVLGLLGLAGHHFVTRPAVRPT